nr:N-alpha-acetyltransferase 60 isoform X1 [Pan troglodytes]
MRLPGPVRGGHSVEPRDLGPETAPPASAHARPGSPEVWPAMSRRPPGARDREGAGPHQCPAYGILGLASHGACPLPTWRQRRAQGAGPRGGGGQWASGLRCRPGAGGGSAAGCRLRPGCGPCRLHNSLRAPRGPISRLPSPPGCAEPYNTSSGRRLPHEDGDILASSFSVDTQVAYILSLGVVKEFRKHGIGSLLLESLKDHISTTAQDHCKAIYLHVLTTNNTAINFYENRDFKQHHYLPYYYSIRGVLKDGFTYVLYINGGHPPWTILDYIQHLGSALASLSPCSIPHRVYRQAHSLLCSFLPWSGISSKSGIEYSRTM